MPSGSRPAAVLERRPRAAVDEAAGAKAKPNARDRDATMQISRRRTAALAWAWGLLPGISYLSGSDG